MKPIVRTASRGDIDMMAEWAASEGWNPGLDDPQAFYSADPNGFLIAEVRGDPAACISVVRYSDAFGFLGFYICRPDYRGRGIGWAIWEAGMDYLSGCTVGLDGVVGQQDNYRKSGFSYAHKNIRYSGLVDCDTPSDPHVCAIEEFHFDDVAEYDGRHFPENRDRFLRQWLFGAQSRNGMALIEDGQVTGYGCIRACREGFKIGPLFADSTAEAEKLFCALSATQPGATVILDVPEPNAEAVALAERYGMSPVFETARMYRGTAPVLPLGSIYGVTTFELG